MQLGDILVAPMTTPEYSPVFSKVKAIVTDEGGVTCHAAVVAREHQIPTIVGTKKPAKLLQIAKK
ncbi:MAG TPA: PEP-utilizing enzyme [Patescibacteria group bacterium]